MFLKVPLDVCWSQLFGIYAEFIDKLSKSGKYIEALKYAGAFGMLDKLDHVDLLTSYLRDVERAGKEVMMDAQGTTASQVFANVYILFIRLEGTWCNTELKIYILICVVDTR